MIARTILIVIFNLLSSLLTAQQITYTSVPNIKDTFDYSEHTFIFNNQVYLQRSRLPENIFFSKLDNFGNPIKNYIFTPKLGYIRFAFHSIQIGSKLFQFGAEEDTIDRRGSVFILNSDLSIFKDSVFFDYPNMEFNVSRYDQKRNKVISTFSYSINKDSFTVRRWGIMELDSLGNPIRKIEMPPRVRYEYIENLLFTSDGKYLAMSKVNGMPSFIKLDTNYNTLWQVDLNSTEKNFFTQGFSENLLELPENKGYVFVGEMKGGKHDNCNYFDSYTSLHFISQSGVVTKDYFHNLSNKNCEVSRPKGLFLKNDSTLMIFTQRDTTSDGVITGKDSGSSLVIHYNFNQHRVTKEIIGGQLLNDKTSWVLPGDNGICFRKHVGRDIDGGFITSGWANINDNNGTSAYLMKTDSCGYTQDHKCKLVYRIGKQVDKSLNLTIDDSLSVLCQPIWTIEGKKYTNLDIVHAFSSWGWHKVKLWGFAGSTADSTEFDVFIDSTKTGIEPVVMNTISVYPNPASDYIEISLSTAIQSRYISGLFQHPTFTLTNLLGQQISPTVEATNRGYRLDTRSLPEGIYLLHIRDKNDNLIKTERIVIQRDQ